MDNSKAIVLAARIGLVATVLGALITAAASLLVTSIERDNSADDSDIEVIFFSGADEQLSFDLFDTTQDKYLGFGVSRTGDPLIQFLDPDGPAAKAGLRLGDELLSVNGSGPFDWMVHDFQVDQPVDVRVRRADSKQTHRLIVSKRPRISSLRDLVQHSSVIWLGPRTDAGWPMYFMKPLIWYPPMASRLEFAILLEYPSMVVADTTVPVRWTLHTPSGKVLAKEKVVQLKAGWHRSHYLVAFEKIDGDWLEGDYTAVLFVQGEEVARYQATIAHSFPTPTTEDKEL